MYCFLLIVFLYVICSGEEGIAAACTAQCVLGLTCTYDGDFAGQLGLLYVSCTKSIPNTNTGSGRESHWELWEVMDPNIY